MMDNGDIPQSDNPILDLLEETHLMEVSINFR